MKLSSPGELLAFLWEAKLWWLIPMIFVLLVLAGIILFAENTPIAPFTYPLF